MSITKQLVEFSLGLRYEDIPPQVVRVQKTSLTDGLSVMVAAAHVEPACSKFVSYAKKNSAPGKSTLLGAEARVSAPMAALANGALSHAVDFEDSHDTALVHSNAVSIPALLAIAEDLGNVTGKELITAMVVASEITCRLSQGLKEDLLQYGWYMPPVHGAMGTVFGLANLMKLSYEETLDAIAILMNSYTCSGESVNSRDSIIRLVRDGFAAQAAVNACLMAKEGIRARFDTPIEGNKGYYMGYARNDYNPDNVVKNLGTVWESGNMSYKPWPCCRATHVTIYLLKRMMKEHNLDVQQIKNIHLTVSDVLRIVLEEARIKYRPTSIPNAKMSLPFAVGLVLTDGDVTLGSFTEDRLQDERILRGGDLVTYDIDKSLAYGGNVQKVAMRITCKDGTVLTDSADYAPGSLELPMTQSEVYAKYQSCMQYSKKERVARNIDHIFEKLMHLEECENISMLTNLF